MSPEIIEEYIATAEVLSARYESIPLTRKLYESPAEHHLVDTGRLYRRHRLPAGWHSSVPDDHRHPFWHPVFQTGGPCANALK